MEVILKKTKITNSILNQTLMANVVDLNTFEVLGFCILKNVKWIILYKPITNELRKYLMFKEVIAEIDNLGNLTQVKVSFDSNHLSRFYKTENNEEGEKFVKLMNMIKHQSIIRGQFFL